VQDALARLQLVCQFTNRKSTSLMVRICRSHDIIIAHRLSTIKNADCIHVMGSGMVWRAAHMMSFSRPKMELCTSCASPETKG